ncbi:sulfotransferase [uncultured Jannaschia sp.]|uniref:sulfotransferase n=1 Tax=uncultured Jannaschia sp. TaxID=293347 RepID=UPI002614423D|nr:sulfotransferase [uncultured Jannaschia sp.]
MVTDKPEDASPKGEHARLDDHSVPIFEGGKSRRHVRQSVSRFRAISVWSAFRYRAALKDLRTFVQFAGWPRSGHSLVGALIDAHPHAAIAHELDTMGLFRKGIPADRLPALCLANAAAFTAAGRHWNGFCYAVPGASHGPAKTLHVVGDKKGDWATRWSAEDPALVSRLACQSRLDCRWILVTRHPLDNISTMSLRRGRAYDKLRISGEQDMGTAIQSAQQDGRIAAEVNDAMIADYCALAASVAAMKTQMPSEKWFEITYETFTERPHESLERLAAFLSLDPDPAWRDRAAALVKSDRNKSRHKLSWRDDQRERVAEVIAGHGFLSAYMDRT